MICEHLQSNSRLFCFNSN